MIDEEAGVREIIQQLSAIRSAMGQAVNEEIVCSIERLSTKKSSLTEEEIAEIKDLMKIAK
jgi:DNA-binding FrmR family transcriptional regulator